MRQARLFGENLLLRRRITTALGSSAIQIEDELTNEGWNRAHMLMYHFNLGFPLVSPTTELAFPKRRVIPCTPLAEQHVAAHTKLQARAAGFAEARVHHGS